VNNKSTDTLKFLKTTAIGGLLFLLPVLVVVGLLGYLYQGIVVVHEHLKHWMPFDSAASVVVLFIVTIAAIVVACFVAGLFAQRAIGVHFSGTIEKRLMKVIPKYGIYKDLLAGTIGGSGNVPTLHPILVRREGVLLLAFQADKLANGMLVVFLPGAPDPWNGSVALVAPEQVQSVQLTFTECVEICEQLGRNASARLNTIRFDAKLP
jgi:uncharacterized membrane protein